MNLVNIDLKEKGVEEKLFLKGSWCAEGKNLAIKRPLIVRYHKNTIFLNNLSFF